MAKGEDAANAAATMPKTCSDDVPESTVSTYYATSNPVTPGGTGSRYFWTNTLGTIYFDLDAVIGDTKGNEPAAAGAPLQYVLSRYSVWGGATRPTPFRCTG
jgi:hypothetical protein